MLLQVTACEIHRLLLMLDPLQVSRGFWSVVDEDYSLPDVTPCWLVSCWRSLLHLCARWPKIRCAGWLKIRRITFLGQPWIWKRQAPPKRRLLVNDQHGLIFQKSIIFRLRLHCRFITIESDRTEVGIFCAELVHVSLRFSHSTDGSTCWWNPITRICEHRILSDAN